MRRKRASDEAPSGAKYRTCEDLPAVLSLDAIDDIPWAELQHAYGDAADVPDHLRAYAGPAEISQRAGGAMYGNIFHQGTRYTASPFTIPFFIGLLVRPELRLDIIERLQAMAYGYEDGLFPGGYDSATAEEHQRAIDFSANQFGIDAAHTHHAVSRAWAHIVPFLDDPNHQVRFEVAHLLAYLPDHAAQSIAELRRRLLRPDPVSLPSMLLALGVLGHQHPGHIAPADVTTAGDSVEARIASLCARCVLGDVQAIEPLIDALGDDLPPIGSWMEGSTLTLVTASIAVHQDWLTLPHLEVVGERLRTAPMFQAPWVAALMLDQVIPPTALPENSQELSVLQRRTLEHLSGAQAWDYQGSINVNWNMRLDAYLVPSKREALARYLAGAPLSDCVAPHLRGHLARVRERETQ